MFTARREQCFEKDKEKKEKELMKNRKFRSSVVKFGRMNYSSVDSMSSRQKGGNTSKLFIIQLTSIENASENHLHCRHHIPKRARFSKVNCGATYEL